MQIVQFRVVHVMALVWPQAREEMDRLQGQRRSEVVTRIRDSGATLEEATRTLGELRQSRPGSAAPRGGQVPPCEKQQPILLLAPAHQPLGNPLVKRPACHWLSLEASMKQQWHTRERALYTDGYRVLVLTLRLC